MGKVSRPMKRKLEGEGHQQNQRKRMNLARHRPNNVGGGGGATSFRNNGGPRPQQGRRSSGVIMSSVQHDFVTVIPNKDQSQFVEETVEIFDPSSYIDEALLQSDSNYAMRKNQSFSGKLVFCDVQKIIEGKTPQNNISQKAQHVLPKLLISVKSKKTCDERGATSSPEFFEPNLVLEEGIKCTSLAPPSATGTKVRNEVEIITVEDGDSNEDWEVPIIEKSFTAKDGLLYFPVDDNVLQEESKEDENPGEEENPEAKTILKEEKKKTEDDCPTSVVSVWEDSSDCSSPGHLSVTLTKSPSTPPQQSTGLCDLCGCIIDDGAGAVGETIEEHVCGECLCSICGEFFENKEQLKSHVDQCFIPTPPPSIEKEKEEEEEEEEEENVDNENMVTNEEDSKEEEKKEPDSKVKVTESDSDSSPEEEAVDENDVEYCPPESEKKKEASPIFRVPSLRPRRQTRNDNYCDEDKKLVTITNTQKIKYPPPPSTSPPHSKALYLCNLCPQKFKHVHDQVEHFVACHQVENYDCDRCLTSFKRPMELFRHIVQAHRSPHEPRIRRVPSYW